MADVNEISHTDGSREQWDDNDRTYTAWDAAGAQVRQRPYTADESAAADARAAEAAALATQQQALTSITALTGQVPAQVAQAQADAAAWPTADAAARDEIMGRVLTGLATITGALGELGVHLGIGQ